MLFSAAGCKSENTVKRNITKPNTVTENLSAYKIDSSDSENKVETYNYTRYDELNELIDASDYVMIASPVEGYADAKQFWLDSFNKETDFSNLDTLFSYTVRKFKVHKVFKGNDSKLKEIEICEHVFVKDGTMKVMSGCTPLQQGDKYILFLNSSNYNKDQYFISLYQGAYNTNDSKNTEDLNIDRQMLNQVKKHFKDEF